MIDGTSLTTKQALKRASDDSNHNPNLPTLNNHEETASARASLLNWYDQHQRQLPWRGIHNPWATWVSEVMLQQTRVNSVLEYFDRFMTRFPTPQALADAECFGSSERGGADRAAKEGAGGRPPPAGK